MDRDDVLLADWRQQALALEDEVAKAVVGQARVIRQVNTAVFARGHVLLQGDVGVGKTTLLRAFTQVLGGRLRARRGHDRPDAQRPRLLRRTSAPRAGRRWNPGR